MTIEPQNLNGAIAAAPIPPHEPPFTTDSIRAWIRAKAEHQHPRIIAIEMAESEFIHGISLRYLSNEHLEQLLRALAAFTAPSSHEAIIGEACERVRKAS